jgi:ATP-dependent RNA helicase SUPV3L1/SUV3
MPSIEAQRIARQLSKANSRKNKEQRDKQRLTLLATDMREQSIEIANIKDEFGYLPDIQQLYATNYHVQKKWHAILGPTNSGKTWKALQALKAAKTGVYLAPLRALALEVGEDLRAQGKRVSIITGEERDIDPLATIVCSTIEMLDISRPVDVAVIDEVQMLGDTDRGWAWTQALLGAPAKDVFLIGSGAAENVIKNLADITKSTLDIEYTERLAPLRLSKQPIILNTIQNGSIYVVFSRKAVIENSEYLRAMGFSVAQIYGNMPPEVRRTEAHRFHNGEADILVATDAIAMGLNMPAHTVVIGDGTKYNGYCVGPIPHPLIRQIAGRAGRYGHHDGGFVAGSYAQLHKEIARALECCDDMLPLKLSLALNNSILANLQLNEDTRITSIIACMQEYIAKGAYSKVFTLALPADYSEKIAVLDLPDVRHNISIKDRITLLCAPVTMRNQSKLYTKYVTAVKNGTKIGVPATSNTDSSTILDGWEDGYRDNALYTWFHYHFPSEFYAVQDAMRNRSTCVEKIENHILSKAIKKQKKIIHPH